MKKLDALGQKFGRLTVIKEAPARSGKTYWHCLCECTRECEVWISALRNGTTKSCGCLSIEMSIARSLTHGASRRGHRTPEYNSWRSIQSRCYDAGQESFKRYGFKGITCCDRWRFGENGISGFECFFADMGEKPTPRHTIDRWPNKKGNYEPSNCRWATKREQAINRCSNVMIEHEGETLCASEVAIKIGMEYGLFISRINRGWTMEKVLANHDKNPRIRTFTIDGVSKNLKDWAKHYNRPYHSVYRQVVLGGWDVMKSLLHKGRVNKR